MLSVKTHADTQTMSLFSLNWRNIKIDETAEFMSGFGEL